jgi:hypothetical protein
MSIKSRAAKGFDDDVIPPSYAMRPVEKDAGRGRESMPASGEQQ